MQNIILASASPRRKELLKLIGLSFRVLPSNIEERLNPRLLPKGQAQALSLAKALAVAKKEKDALIIGADTIVCIDKQILGKPSSDDDAKRMLRKLSGKMHIVITGFTIIDNKTNKIVTKAEETKVYMRSLSAKEIASYVASEDLSDKAGAYAIQGKGAIFFEKIVGDYFNIVGLPVFSLAKELKRFGISVF